MGTDGLLSMTDQSLLIFTFSSFFLCLFIDRVSLCDLDSCETHLPFEGQRLTSYSRLVPLSYMYKYFRTQTYTARYSAVPISFTPSEIKETDGTNIYSKQESEGS